MPKPPSSRLTPLPPPLKWAGGKRWLVPSLQLLWQTSGARRLVEPFAGGLSIALGLQPKLALLNDANPHLINFYKQIQRGLHLDDLPANHADDFYAARADFNDLIKTKQDETSEAARLFYYLNRTGFNGLCRFNRQGLFNVPFGDNNDTPTKDLTPYTEIFRTWRFLSEDFAALEIQSGDFVYADPPYDGTFVQYSRYGFSWQDQERLALWLSGLPSVVVSSNQATERILKLYHEASFHVLTAQAPRRISCNGDRSPALEMLAFKALEAVELPGFTPYSPSPLFASPETAPLSPPSSEALPSLESPLTPSLPSSLSPSLSSEAPPQRPESPAHPSKDSPQAVSSKPSKAKTKPPSQPKGESA